MQAREGNKAPKRERISQARLIGEYGFTKKLISDLLPEPMLSKNPHYSSAAPMKTWYLDEVEAVMEGKAFRNAKAKADAARASRRAGAAKAVKTKTDRLMRLVESRIQDIAVERIPSGSVMDLALESKQSWYDSIEDERYAGRTVEGADRQTKARWAVNYIRHELTEYDYDLYGMAGKVGCHEAYIRYRNAVLDRIAEAYPEYEAECRRQHVGKGGMDEDAGR